MSEVRAPSAWQLQRVVSLAMATIEALRTDHGQVFDDEDDVLAALSQEGIGVEEILRRLVRAAAESAASANAVDQRIRDLKMRQARFEHQEERYRDAVLNVMQALGLTKFKDPEFNLSVRDGKPKVIVTDEKMISDDFMTFTITRTPNKAAIKQRIDETGEVPGAILSQAPPVLTVRTR